MTAPNVSPLSRAASDKQNVRRRRRSEGLRADDAIDPAPAPAPLVIARAATLLRRTPAPMRTNFNAAQLKIIRTTIARELTQSEFDQFMETAHRTGLDPLRRQIVPLLLARHDPERRTLTPIATIDGLRAIAARAGDYRPMETPPKITAKRNAVDPHTNPLGLVRAEALVWKHDGRSWRPVAGEAWWDEYAPLRPTELTPTEKNPPAGRDARGANAMEAERPPRTLAEPWRRMGRVMIAKCAEAQALRRGWPEDLAGLYGQEELARAHTEDLTASDRVLAYDAQREAEALAGGKALLLALSPEAPLTRVPLSDAGAALREAYAAVTTLADLDAFEIRNRVALKHFWSMAQAEAFAIKRLAEERRTQLIAETAP